MSKDSEAHKQEEEKLIAERDAKIAELKTYHDDCKAKERKLQGVRSLRAQFETEKREAEEKLKHNFEEDGQIREERNRIDELQKDLESQNTPKKEATAQLELLEAREDFIKEELERRKETLHMEISEIRYRKQLIVAKRKEIQSRVDCMTEFLRAKHPEVLSEMNQDDTSVNKEMKKRVERKEEENVQEKRKRVEVLTMECNLLREERDRLKRMLDELCHGRKGK